MVNQNQCEESFDYKYEELGGVELSVICEPSKYQVSSNIVVRCIVAKPNKNKTIMILLRLFEFIVIYSFIKLFVFCDFTTSSEEEHVNVNSLNENSAENIVLDSVYDTMKNNYELRMQQNMQKMNLMSEIRNKRNINEPINSQNSMEVYRNHQLNMNPNAKVPMGYPVGFKPSQPKYYQQVVGPPAFPNPRDRSEYEYEE